MRRAECQGERRPAREPPLQFRTPHSALRIGGGPVTVWDSACVSSALGVSGPRDLRFSGVGTDPRHLTPGTLFVALQGDRFDDHAFLAQARAQGAAAAVVRAGTPPMEGLPFFEVPDTLADRKSTRLNSSHLVISYAVFCLKKKKKHYFCYHNYIIRAQT